MCICSRSWFQLCFSLVQEEELERQKREQVVLLQELEEQKARLEELLLEARQEREDLKAAVTQAAPVNQPEVLICDQEVTSITPVRECIEQIKGFSSLQAQRKYIRD